jgi:hypothetical protein
MSLQVHPQRLTVLADRANSLEQSKLVHYASYFEIADCTIFKLHSPKLAKGLETSEYSSDKSQTLVVPRSGRVLQSNSIPVPSL